MCPLVCVFCQTLKCPGAAAWLFVEMSINGTLGVLLNWFHLLGTLGSCQRSARSPLRIPASSNPPKSALLQAQPQAPPSEPPTAAAAAALLTPPSPSSPGGAKNVGGFPASVWDLARQKLRVTSTPSHFEMDPWWQLLGEPSDVSISLSKEIARGSAGSP